jgi:hypothetical protein
MRRVIVTRLRVLRRGWGRFTAEEVTLVDLDSQGAGPVASEVDLEDVLDLDDEDAEAGLPYGQKRPN